MAITLTTNYSFTKPEIGASENTWGGFLNGNWDDLDTLLGGVTAVQFAYLDVTALGTSEASKVVTADANGDVKFTNAVVETVYTITGTSAALNPNNGTIQTHALSANTTYTDSFAAGESITLMLTYSTAYTVTWPTMTWINNEGDAPTLGTSGLVVVVLWKVGSTLYGALAGDGT